MALSIHNTSTYCGPQRLIGPEHPYNLQMAIERFERGYLQNILQLTCGDLRETARLLGIEQDVLTTKLTYYNLSRL